ncbi:Klotho [Liparis tanakae]|uniref:Klotho n=1 Tax=Liparis tanakae TaxID=230148 RepID=A0A4Z2E611_9TELE|nr:Klotho [Liparis tanakae]
MDWVEPAFSSSREKVEPAKRVLDFRVGWFAEPIFGSGDYPLGMRSWLRQLNSLEYKCLVLTSILSLCGLKNKRRSLEAREDMYTYSAELEVQHMIDTTWIMSPWPVVPWGLRKALNWVSPVGVS